MATAPTTTVSTGSRAAYISTTPTLNYTATATAAAAAAAASAAAAAAAAHTSAINYGPLVLDGGMGMELARRQRELVNVSGAWSAEALIRAPDLVSEVHRDFALAGAEVITTNSCKCHLISHIQG